MSSRQHRCLNSTEIFSHQSLWCLSLPDPCQMCVDTGRTCCRSKRDHHLVRTTALRNQTNLKSTDCHCSTVSSKQNRKMKQNVNAICCFRFGLTFIDDIACPEAVKMRIIGLVDDPPNLTNSFASRIMAIGPPYGAANTFICINSVSGDHSIEYSSHLLQIGRKNARKLESSLCPKTISFTDRLFLAAK